jgi:two-component system cell cycle sensor histidine kinase/response regulator CckA
VGVLGGAEVLLELSSDPEVIDGAEMIRESALRSSELTKRLLEFARRGPIRAEPLDLHQVVRDAEALLTRSVGPSVTLVTKLEASTSTVRGDEALLQHALLNLILNARDALPAGGTVTIATSDVVLDEEEARSLGSTAGRYVRLSVADDGVGMADATQARLFEPFYTTKADGTGLGLSVVYGTIQRHAGTVRVESAPGRGATFELLLPVADGLPRDRASLQSTAATSGRVLVVDDEPHVRRAVAAMLRSLGHGVSCCADGESAVDWVRDHQDGVDLVLLDVVMPGLGGIRAHEAIHAFAPALPVVLMSGFAADGEVEKALAGGVRAFLSKPFTRQELTRMLDDCLAE